MRSSATNRSTPPHRDRWSRWNRRSRSCRLCRHTWYPPNRGHRSRRRFHRRRFGVVQRARLRMSGRERTAERLRPLAPPVVVVDVPCVPAVGAATGPVRGAARRRADVRHSSRIGPRRRADRRRPVGWGGAAGDVVAVLTFAAIGRRVDRRITGLCNVGRITERRRPATTRTRRRAAVRGGAPPNLPWRARLDESAS